MIKLKNTNTKVFKTKVFDYLIDSAYDCEALTKKQTVQHIHDRFVNEFCHEYNVRRYPNDQERVKEWLQGLALNVCYTYADIIDTAAWWHGFDKSELTDKQETTILDNWFNFLAFKMLQMFKAYEIDSNFT